MNLKRVKVQKDRTQKVVPDDVLRLTKKLFRDKPEEGIIMISCDGAGAREREGIRYGGTGISICMKEGDDIIFQELMCSYNSDAMTSIMAEFLAIRDACSVAQSIHDENPGRKIMILNDSMYVCEAVWFKERVRPHLELIQNEIQWYRDQAWFDLCWFDRSLNVVADGLSKIAVENHELSMKI